MSVRPPLFEAGWVSSGQMRKVPAERVSELGGNGLLEWALRTGSQTWSRASGFLQYLSLHIAPAHQGSHPESPYTF